MIRFASQHDSCVLCRPHCFCQSLSVWTWFAFKTSHKWWCMVIWQVTWNFALLISVKFKTLMILPWHYFILTDTFCWWHGSMPDDSYIRIIRVNPPPVALLLFMYSLTCSSYILYAPFRGRVLPWKQPRREAEGMCMYVGRRRSDLSPTHINTPIIIHIYL